MVDKSGDGKIQKKEFVRAHVALLESKGYTVTKEDKEFLRGAFDFLAKTGDGDDTVISKAEWAGIVDKLFKHIDEVFGNGDGLVSDCEYLSALKWARDNLGKDE
jgi:hypothetical protein